jgi:hypothetical protein
VICFEGLQIMLFRFAPAAALAATASMIATPLIAAEVPNLAPPVAVASSGVFDAKGVNAAQYRRWRHHDRVDAGDVIAGVLVLGTIAAVASAASSAKRDRDYRYPRTYPSPDRPYDYRSRSTDWRSGDSRGIDRAVDTCAREVERNSAIGTVDNVQRTGTGWRVSGRLRSGAPFDCSIGNDGRVEGVDYAREGAAGDSQWDDQRYAAARQAQDGYEVPAYPGAPSGDDARDGRYEADQSPDFPG